VTSFYNRRILPSFLSCACGAKPIMRQRAKVAPLAEGRVLEVGMGGGLNLAFYDPGRVSVVVGVDPSAELRSRAEGAPRPDGLKVSIAEGVAEDLPFAAASFDTVVCTYTLCSVDNPARSLAEARRVLKPEGRLLFCEHGLAPDPSVARWQRRIEPVWKRIAGGCRLTRPVGEAIREAGFVFEALERMYLPGTPRFAGWHEWGAARPAPR